VPTKYLGAFKAGHRKSVRDFIDHDEFSFELLKKAEAGDPEAARALEWLAKYNREFYKGFLRKNDKTAIHNTPKLYKEATAAHNARRRDFCHGLAPSEAAEHKNASDPPSALIDEFLNKNPNLSHEECMIDLISPKAQRRLELIKKRKP
jgi:hypothetical protein